MIQDILTHGIVIFSMILVIRSFVRFFTVKLNGENDSLVHGHDCGSCSSSCSLKNVMNTIEENTREIRSVNTGVLK
jgi:hypothetical protein